MVFRAKPIAKSQLRFQTDWSGNGSPGQLWQMESTLMQASVKCSFRSMKKTSHKFYKEELTIVVSFSGDFCRHRIQTWKSPTNGVSSTYVHPCHPWLQTAENGFNADMFHIKIISQYFCLSFQGINWSCKLLFCYLLSWWPYQPVMATWECVTTPTGPSIVHPLQTSTRLPWTHTFAPILSLLLQLLTIKTR